MRPFQIAKALQDPDRYLDVIPMKFNQQEQCLMHIDEFPHGTEPDAYDFMVRNTELSEETLYCEIEDILPEQYDAVESMLLGMYGLRDECTIMSPLSLTTGELIDQMKIQVNAEAT